MNPTPAQPGMTAGDKTTGTEKTAVQKAPAGRVAFVGAGPGDEEMLTVRAGVALRQADLVIAAPWPSERFAHLLKDGATLAYSAGLQDDPKMIVKAARAGQSVVRVFSGDPFMFCHAAPEAAACAEAEVSF